MSALSTLEQETGVTASSSLDGHRLCGEGAQHQQALCVCQRMLLRRRVLLLCAMCWKSTVMWAVCVVFQPSQYHSTQPTPTSSTPRAMLLCSTSPLLPSPSSVCSCSLIWTDSSQPQFVLQLYCGFHGDGSVITFDW